MPDGPRQCPTKQLKLIERIKQLTLIERIKQLTLIERIKQLTLIERIWCRSGFRCL
jgi:hypothetical protein